MLEKRTKLLLFFAAFFLVSEVFAAEKILVVQGNERVDEGTILSLLDVGGLKKNTELSRRVSLKKLYESDLFLEARIYEDGGKIIVEIKENPLISDIKFIGNKKIETEALQAEITSKKRTVFTKSKLQNDLKRLGEIYLKSGRFLTKIDPKIIQKDQNRVELIFDIAEGPKAKIGKVYFVGNQAFSDRELIDEISTKESKWWKFLSSSDSYDSDRIEFDKEKLRRFYGSNGYADFTTISATAQIMPQKTEFFVTFLLEEGVQYKVGETNILNHIEKFDASILNKEILLKEGKIYNSDLVEKTIDKMVELMSEKSYAFAHIEPILKRNRETKIIDIDFVISETPRIYINQIRIFGNTHTMDSVIRRELRFREGDPYNVTKINRSKQRLENLGFFEKVEFRNKRIGETDKMDLEIEVKEKKTGELNLGVGYSTVNRLTLSTGIKERNMFGTGQELGFNIQKSFASLTADVNYTKPYFMNLPLDAGIDLFKYDFSKRNSLIYDQQSSGLTLRGDYSLTEFLSHQLRYSYSEQIINNISPGASISIQMLQGSYVTSGIGQSIFYDKRDNKINPRDGYYVSLSQDYSGIGGNINMLKHEGSAGYYLPTTSKDFVLKFMARGGVIEGLGGQAVRSNYGFFLGGNNFRGFQYAGLGPRTQDSSGRAVGGSVIGGKIYYVGTAEFMFPLGLPRELGINGVFFSDNGTVKGVDQQTRAGTNISDSGSIRSSYGFSIAWSSPLGPIRLDFARIARKEIYDQTQTFRFSFGTTF
ncbi:MAG: outer membrane protein assembly factor BamA [Alphaproteobacteria bacterium]|nr:outer membrane protein assembly factor BamA [Alphaproteobacteria bacterium]